MRLVIASALLGSVFLLSACQPGDPDKAVQAHSALPFEQVFPVERQIRMISSEDDPIAVPVAVTLWGDRLAVVDVVQTNVKVFDLNGHLVMTLGRAGDGPGEFRSPMTAVETGDGRLAVFDQQSSRVSYFAKDGSYLGGWNTHSFRQGAFTSFGDGTQFLLTGRLQEEHPDVPVDTPGRSLHFFDLEGARVRSIGEAPVAKNLYEGNLHTIMGAMVGGVAVSGLRTSNLFTHHDLATGRSWEFTLTPPIYKPYVWPKERFRLDEELLHVQKWANSRTWVNRIIPLDSLHYMVSFGTGDSEGKNIRHQYVISRIDGSWQKATHSTPVFLHQAPRQPNLIGSRMDEDGNFDVWIYRIPDLEN